jgi:hypothetical protein
MDWTITTTDSVPGVVRINVSGLASTDECERLVKEVLSRADWQANSKLLIDCRSVNIKQLRFDEIDRSSMIMRDNGDGFGSAKIAIIATAGVGFGIGRQFKSVTEAKTDICVEVFNDESDAMRWISDERSNANAV